MRVVIAAYRFDVLLLFVVSVDEDGRMSHQQKLDNFLLLDVLFSKCL